MKRHPDRTDIDDHGLSETIPQRERDPTERLRAWLHREIAAAEANIRDAVAFIDKDEFRSVTLARMTARREALVQALDWLG